MAETGLHSSTQTEIARADCPPAIRNALDELNAHPFVRNARALTWNEHHVALAMEIAVDRPSRDTPSGADIQQHEPMLFVCNKGRYPYAAPSVFADRKDFPTDLPHLNPQRAGIPRWLCVYRGNLDDWFIEHSIGDLVDRARSWLHDAVMGTLNRDSDRFEPTRVDDLSSCAFFPYDEFIRLAASAPAIPSSCIPLRFWVLEERERIGDDGYAIRFERVLAPDQIAKEAGTSRAANDLQETLGSRRRRLTGALLIPKAFEPCGKYFGIVPHDYRSLDAFAAELGFDLQGAIGWLAKQDLLPLKGLPLFFPIKRPRRLIGRETDIEVVSLVLLRDQMKDHGSVPDDAPVFLLAHKEPLTPEFARAISHRRIEEALPKTMVLGCGALGSKIALHLGRGGDLDLTLVDKDDTSAHNMVRHGLLYDAVGRNKAEAAREAIVALYPGRVAKERVAAINRDVRDILLDAPNSEVADRALLVDCTASSSVFESLIATRLPETCRAFRCEVADDGRLGYWFAEGPGRSPRVDDLRMLLFDLARTNPGISDWLVEFRRRAHERSDGQFEELNIGVSCSSDTLRLADDILSYHASVAAMCLRELPDAGELGLSAWGSAGDYPGVVNRSVVGPTIVCRPAEASDWTVRILDRAAQLMRRLFVEAGSSETGGILLGQFHPRRKIVYVTAAVGPPEDSRGTAGGFTRGVVGLREELEHAKQSSGGVIDYVGEWHTHPRGGGLSNIDRATAEEIRAALRTTDRPAHILIVTPTGFGSHLFLRTDRGG